MKVKYLYETDKESIKTYYQMKNKLHYRFNEDEKTHFIAKVIQAIKEHYQLDSYDVLLIPDTKNECFKEIVSQLNMPTVVLRKNTKEQLWHN